MFESTGDDLIDKWEQELAMGIEPDLTEGLPQEEKDKLYAEREKASSTRRKANEVTSIDERFVDSLRENPMYAPKSGGVLGSGEAPGISPLNILGKNRG